MRFLKSFFRSDPKERIREKLLEFDIPKTAVYLPDAIEEDDFHLVKEVAADLVSSDQLDGALIGKKGWFLPNASDKLAVVWDQIEKGAINLEDISKQWDINEKRVFIALKDYATTKNLSDPVFHREDMTLYLESYFSQAWYDVLAGYDIEEPKELSKLIDQVRIAKEAKPIFESKVKQWLSDPASKFALGSDGILRAKETIPELIIDFVSDQWENEAPQVTYEELADRYGMSRKEIGSILQNLIDKRLLGEVTLYATDELIKPRP